MLGTKLLEKSKMPMSAVAKEQFDAACEAVNKLAEASGMCWDLTTSRLFDQVRLVCFAQGAAVAAGAIGIYSLIKKNNEEQDNKTK